MISESYHFTSSSQGFDGNTRKANACARFRNDQRRIGIVLRQQTIGVAITQRQIRRGLLQRLKMEAVFVQQQNVAVSLGPLQRWNQLAPRVVAREWATAGRLQHIFGVSTA